MKRLCGAKLRGKDRTCRKPPMANGKCRLHGGLTPNGPASANYQHGRYASVFKGRLAEKFQRADEKPLDLLPELRVQRTLLTQYIEKVGDKDSFVELKRISALTEDVVRTAATIAKVRNETALTVAEIKFIQIEMLRLINEFIPDPERRRNFIERLRAVVPRRVIAERVEALPAGAEAAGEPA
jgi:hypothetical protein